MKQWTAFFFATTAIHAAAKQLPVYAAVAASLCASSYVFHTSDKTDYQDKPFYWIDQACIIALAAVGLYYMVYHIDKKYSIVGCITALLTALLYWGGYFSGTCCFDPCENNALFTHCCMHFVAALGHHCVIAGL